MFFRKFIPEKDKPQEENINTAPHFFILIDDFPGRFHLFTPVDIIKYDNGSFFCFFQQFMEIGQRRRLAMIGIDPALSAIILGVDRILDMCRTTLNVVGDITAATFVARSEGHELLQAPEAAGIG